MNKERRKRIESIIDKLADISSEIEDISIEEQEAFDNLPESLQSGENGQKIEEAISSLGEISATLEEAKTALSEL